MLHTSGMTNLDAHRLRCYRSNGDVQKALGDENGRRPTILEAKDFSRPSHYFLTTPISGSAQTVHPFISYCCTVARRTTSSEGVFVCESVSAVIITLK